MSIRLEGLSKRMGRTPALKKLSLDFQAGLMHGVIGPEGAGKTTLLRLLTGLLKPNEGTIQFFREGLPTEFSKVRAEIAYMPQQQSLYADLSIAEHLDFFRALYRIGPQDFASRKKELLAITRLDKFEDRPAGKLSGGMYKKLGLVCALLRSPSILLLDEPTNGVDPISRREFWELLYRLSTQKILILITTAYMDEAERCARTHLIEEGHLLATGEPKEILAHHGVRNFDEFFLKRAGLGDQ
jgi:ABC-2 type transport system ATP-binding protein